MSKDVKQQMEGDVQAVESLPVFDFEMSGQLTPVGDDVELQALQMQATLPSQINSDQTESARTPFIVSSNLEKTKLLPPKAFHRQSRGLPPAFHNRRVHLPRQITQIILILGVIVAPVAVVVRVAFPLTRGGGNLPYYDCTLDGTFTFKGIDIPYGNMTFAQAKAIDLAWNTIIGRCLQTALTVFAYNVAMRALMQISERDQISYDIFAALALSKISISTILPLAKSINSKLHWQSRCALSWLLVTTIYLASFPTFIDATSGYQASQLTKLKLFNGSTLDVTQGLGRYVSFIDIYRTDLDIYAGSIVLTSALPRPRPILDGSLGIQWKVPLETQPYYTSGRGYASLSGCILQGDPAVSTNATSNSTYYVYSACSSHNTSLLTLSETTFIHPRERSGLVKMVLNQTIDDPSCINWFSLLRPFDGSHLGFKFSDALGIWWLKNEILFDRNSYDCVSSDFYQWGFSYAWLLIICILNAVWVFGTCILWLDAEYNSEFVKKRRIFGTWRAVLDLAEAINQDLGKDTCAYSEEEIETSLKERGPVMYVVEERDGIGHVGLRSSDASEPTERLRLEWGKVYGRKGWGKMSD